MRYLFVHQNYPGQYLHPLRHLAEQGGHQIVFISEPNTNHIAGVQRAYYQFRKSAQTQVHPHARDFDQQVRRAELVARTAANLKRLGFTPDVVVGHHGWGELLNLPDVWPGVPILGYFEYFYRTEGQDVGYDPEFPVEEGRAAKVRAMNTVNLLALALDQHGQTPTRWQHTRYPDWARDRIRVIPEGVRLDLCHPDPGAARRPFELGGFSVAPKERLVTYVCRNLEPYRGFHILMRALPRLLSERSDTRVIVVGGDEVSYGARLQGTTWRAHMRRELAGRYDESRVLFAGQIPYEAYLSLLRRSDAHIYLSYPFVASWSLREAMACGCAIVAADVAPVAEFITHERTGVLVPGLDPNAVADAVLALLADPARSRRLRAAARRHAEAHLDVATQLAAFDRTIAEITGAAAGAAAGPTPAATVAATPGAALDRPRAAERSPVNAARPAPARVGLAPARA
jgi:glycosyltransferase involved in cell wall biosynthesis